MAACEFSEFSYGFALTHSIVGALGSVLGKAPIFPSLIQEGSSGGGYDVKLPLVPFPIFLQFKIPAVLTRSSSLKPAAYATPYYRFPFRTKLPNQHQLLLDLEAVQPLVSYVAPLFHELSYLDHYFSLSSVHQHSAYVRPSQIGPLDVTSHHLNYRPGEAIYWLRSDPKAMEGDFRYEGFAQRITRHREAIRSELNLQKRFVDADEGNERRRHLFFQLRDQLFELERKATNIAEQASEIPEGRIGRATITSIFDTSKRADVPPTPIFRLEDLEPSEMARRLAFIAQVRFGLTLAFGEAANPNQNA